MSSKFGKEAFSLTVEQLRIAARKKGRPRATCADETLRLINALQANNWDASKVYKPYVVEADKCMEKAAADRKKRKLNTLHHLQKYVTQRK